MARKTNENSTRQLAFKQLENFPIDIGRKEASEKLMSEFNIKRPYAMTIIQQFRTKQRESGAYTTVYLVRDMKDNKSTSPYMSSTHIPNPSENDATSPSDAVNVYCNSQTTKIALARNLKVPIDNVEKTETNTVSKESSTDEIPA